MISHQAFRVGDDNNVMTALIGEFLQAFIPLFVAIDPIGLAAIFVSLSISTPEKRHSAIAVQAISTAAIVALIFLFLGQGIFQALGISVADFQIAGGLILLVFAIRDLVLTNTKTDQVTEDFGVVPLGLPIIAGPAMLATVLVCVQAHGLLITLLALITNLALAALALLQSHRLTRLISATGLRAISKIVSLLLAAIAVSLIRQGWKG